MKDILPKLLEFLHLSSGHGLNNVTFAFVYWLLFIRCK